MRRWHSERDLMLRRWRQELAKHGTAEPGSRWRWGMPHMSLAPPSLAPSVDCHCAHGIGAMRKRKPHDCGKTRCFTCHYEKLLPKPRSTARREAIEYEVTA